MRYKACGIVLQDNKLMFMQQMVHGKLRHVFVGGGLEKDETPEQAVLRELQEEANVEGEIIFGPVQYENEKDLMEYVFVLNIKDNQTPVLGYDPEIHENEEQVLKGIVWRDLCTEKDLFTEIDKQFIMTLVNCAKKKNIEADWLISLESVLL